MRLIFSVLLLAVSTMGFAATYNVDMNNMSGIGCVHKDLMAEPNDLRVNKGLLQRYTLTVIDVKDNQIALNVEWVNINNRNNNLWNLLIKSLLKLQ